MQFEPMPGSTGTATKSIASLEDYLEAVRRRKALVAICTIGLLALSMWFTSNRTKQYRTAARVVVSPSPVGSTSGAPVAPNLERETALIVSDSIAEAARGAAGNGYGTVTATFTPLSDVVVVQAESTNPSYAAALATAYAEEYVNRRVTAQKDFYTATGKQLTDELASVQARIADAQKSLSDLDARRVNANGLPAGDVRSRELENITAANQTLQASLNQDQARLRALEQQLLDYRRTQSTQLPAAAIISAAGVPSKPTGLRPIVLWITAALVGLALGVVAAFTRERLDRRAAASRDVELALGTRMLGTVPRFGWRNRSGKWALIMANDTPGQGAQKAREAYRRLRSSVMFLQRGENIRRVVITSHRPQEGKSTTSANLAISIALGGTRVALVSADLRRSSLERTFGMNNDLGLTSFLTGVTETLRKERVDGIEDLTIIPAGPEVGNPGELLGSARFAQAIEWLSAEYDLVIIDTPPLSVAADALAAAGQADGVIVVVDGDRTETTDLLAIRSQLDRSGNRLLGAVLNRDSSDKGGFFNRGGYGYYSESAAPKRFGRKPARAAVE